MNWQAKITNGSVVQHHFTAQELLTTSPIGIFKPVNDQKAGVIIVFPNYYSENRAVLFKTNDGWIETFHKSSWRDDKFVLTNATEINLVLKD